MRSPGWNKKRKFFSSDAVPAATGFPSAYMEGILQPLRFSVETIGDRQRCVPIACCRDRSWLSPP